MKTDQPKNTFPNSGLAISFKPTASSESKPGEYQIVSNPFGKESGTEKEVPEWLLKKPEKKEPTTEEKAPS